MSAVPSEALRERRRRDAGFRRFWVGLRVGDHCVYRLYDDKGRLLYVGISTQLRERMRSHYRKKEWGRDVARLEVEWGLTRHQALSREREIILNDSPLHNATFYAPPKWVGAF